MWSWGDGDAYLEPELDPSDPAAASTVWGVVASLGDSAAETWQALISEVGETARSGQQVVGAVATQPAAIAESAASPLESAADALKWIGLGVAAVVAVDLGANKGATLRGLL